LQNKDNQQQQQQPAQTPSLFGNTAAGSTATQPTTSNAFGKLASDLYSANMARQMMLISIYVGPFGVPSNTTATSASTTQPPAGTSNIFGNANTTQPAGMTATNLFGTTANTGTTSNLFGSTTNTTNPATNLFGTNTTTTSNNPLFGGNTNTTAPAAPNSLFPSTTAAAGASTTTNPFGAGNTLGTWGVNKPAQSTSSALQVGSVLGAAKTAPAPADAQAQYQRLLQKVEAIVQAWNPAHPNCRFHVRVSSNN
jgi:nuclear pore complex protein Nup54